MIADIHITHQRSGADPSAILPLCDKLGQALADLSPDGDWKAEQLDKLAADMTELLAKFASYYTKCVNGYRIGDRVELHDQTIAKISGFADGDRFIEFARANGTKGRAEIAYIKGRK
jgi:hypothetical protein